MGWTPECARESFSRGQILITGFVGFNAAGQQRLQSTPHTSAELTGLKVTVKLSNNALDGGVGGLRAHLFVFVQESDFGAEQPRLFAPV